MHNGEGASVYALLSTPGGGPRNGEDSEMLQFILPADGCPDCHLRCRLPRAVWVSRRLRACHPLRLLRFRQTNVRILVILFRLFRLRFLGLLRLFRGVRILLPLLGRGLFHRKSLTIRGVNIFCALVKTCNQLGDQFRLNRSRSIDVFVL